jgi:hypothetical protein
MGMSNQQPEYGLVVLLRPATLRAPLFAVGLQVSRRSFTLQSELLLSGFLPAPFKPPRS